MFVWDFGLRRKIEKKNQTNKNGQSKASNLYIGPSNCSKCCGKITFRYKGYVYVVLLRNIESFMSFKIILLL